MKARLFLCAMGMMLMPSFIRACDVLPVASVFFLQSDANRDGVVDAAEWQLVQPPPDAPYNIHFRIGSTAAFKRFDLDRNGLLTEEELPYTAVSYREDPCAKWLKYINRNQ